MYCQILDTYEIEVEKRKNYTSQNAKEYCNLGLGGGTLQPYQPGCPISIYFNECFATKLNKI